MHHPKHEEIRKIKGELYYDALFQNYRILPQRKHLLYNGQQWNVREALAVFRFRYFKRL